MITIEVLESEEVIKALPGGYEYDIEIRNGHARIVTYDDTGKEISIIQKEVDVIEIEKKITTLLVESLLK